MVIRTVNYKINGENGSYLLPPDNIVNTINYLSKLDSELNVSELRTLVDNSPTVKYPVNIRGMEDIRIFSDQYFLCTCADVNPQRVPQICWGAFETDGTVTKLIPLQPHPEIDCQKNWLPFIDGSQIKFIYSYDPLIIYSLDPESGVIEKILERKLNDLDLTSFRGSAGLIPYRKGWLGTIHQVHYFSPRKYYTRFIWFDAEFTEMKFSDPFYFHSIGIEFNAGIAHHPDGLLLTYSVFDHSTNLVLVDYCLVDKFLLF
jgi:hypothetical protein